MIPGIPGNSAAARASRALALAEMRAAAVRAAAAKARAAEAAAAAKARAAETRRENARAQNQVNAHKVARKQVDTQARQARQAQNAETRRENARAQNQTNAHKVAQKQAGLQRNKEAAQRALDTAGEAQRELAAATRGLTAPVRSLPGETAAGRDARLQSHAAQRDLIEQQRARYHADRNLAWAQKSLAEEQLAGKKGHGIDQARHLVSSEKHRQQKAELAFQLALNKGQRLGLVSDSEERVRELRNETTAQFGAGLGVLSKSGDTGTAGMLSRTAGRPSQLVHAELVVARKDAVQAREANALADGYVALSRKIDKDIHRLNNDKHLSAGQFKELLAEIDKTDRQVMNLGRQLGSAGQGEDLAKVRIRASVSEWRALNARQTLLDTTGNSKADRQTRAMALAEHNLALRDARLDANLLVKLGPEHDLESIALQAGQRVNPAYEVGRYDQLDFGAQTTYDPGKTQLDLSEDRYVLLPTDYNPVQGLNPMRAGAGRNKDEIKDLGGGIWSVKPGKVPSIGGVPVTNIQMVQDARTGDFSVTYEVNGNPVAARLDKPHSQLWAGAAKSRERTDWLADTNRQVAVAAEINASASARVRSLEGPGRTATGSPGVAGRAKEGGTATAQSDALARQLDRAQAQAMRRPQDKALAEQISALQSRYLDAMGRERTRDLSRAQFAYRQELESVTSSGPGSPDRIDDRLEDERQRVQQDEAGYALIRQAAQAEFDRTHRTTADHYDEQKKANFKANAAVLGKIDVEAWQVSHPGGDKTTLHNRAEATDFVRQQYGSLDDEEIKTIVDNMVEKKGHLWWKKDDWGTGGVTVQTRMGDAPEYGTPGGIQDNLILSTTQKRAGHDLEQRTLDIDTRLLGHRWESAGSAAIGAFEVLGGAGVASLTWWSGGGGVAGSVIAADGGVRFGHGIYDVIRNKRSEAWGSQGLQRLGVDKNTANTIDSAVGLAGGMAGGVAGVRLIGAKGLAAIEAGRTVRGAGNLVSAAGNSAMLVDASASGVLGLSGHSKLGFITDTSMLTRAVMKQTGWTRGQSETASMVLTMGGSILTPHVVKGGEAIGARARNSLAGRRPAPTPPSVPDFTSGYTFSRTADDQVVGSRPRELPAGTNAAPHSRVIDPSGRPVNDTTSGPVLALVRQPDGSYGDPQSGAAKAPESPATPRDGTGRNDKDAGFNTIPGALKVAAGSLGFIAVTTQDPRMVALTALTMAATSPLIARKILPDRAMRAAKEGKVRKAERLALRMEMHGDWAAAARVRHLIEEVQVRRGDRPAAGRADDKGAAELPTLGTGAAAFVAAGGVFAATHDPLLAGVAFGTGAVGALALRLQSARSAARASRAQASQRGRSSLADAAHDANAYPPLRGLQRLREDTAAWQAALDARDTLRPRDPREALHFDRQTESMRSALLEWRRELPAMFARNPEAMDAWLASYGEPLRNESPAPTSGSSAIELALPGHRAAGESVAGSNTPKPGEALVGSSPREMRKSVNRVLGADRAHPLRFLVDPATGELWTHSHYVSARGARAAELIRADKDSELGFLLDKRGDFKPVKKIGKADRRRAEAIILAASPNRDGPLSFLLDADDKFRAGLSHDELADLPKLMEMGHIVSRKRGGREYVMLQGAYENRFNNWSIESPHKGGSVIAQPVVEIGGIAVDLQTARNWVVQGLLDPVVLKNAPAVHATGTGRSGNDAGVAAIPGVPAGTTGDEGAANLPTVGAGAAAFVAAGSAFAATHDPLLAGAAFGVGALGALAVRLQSARSAGGPSPTGTSRSRIVVRRIRDVLGSLVARGERAAADGDAAKAGRIATRLERSGNAGAARIHRVLAQRAALAGDADARQLATRLRDAGDVETANAVEGSIAARETVNRAATDSPAAARAWQAVQDIFARDGAGPPHIELADLLLDPSSRNADTVSADLVRQAAAPELQPDFELALQARDARQSLATLGPNASPLDRASFESAAAAISEAAGREAIVNATDSAVQAVRADSTLKELALAKMNLPPAEADLLDLSPGEMSRLQHDQARLQPMSGADRQTLVGAATQARDVHRAYQQLRSSASAIALPSRSRVFASSAAGAGAVAAFTAAGAGGVLLFEHVAAPGWVLPVVAAGSVVRAGIKRWRFGDAAGKDKWHQQMDKHVDGKGRYEAALNKIGTGMSDDAKAAFKEDAQALGDRKLDRLKSRPQRQQAMADRRDALRQKALAAGTSLNPAEVDTQIRLMQDNLVHKTSFDRSLQKYDKLVQRLERAAGPAGFLSGLSPEMRNAVRDQVSELRAAEEALRDSTPGNDVPALARLKAAVGELKKLGASLRPADSLVRLGIDFIQMGTYGAGLGYLAIAHPSGWGYVGAYALAAASVIDGTRLSGIRFGDLLKAKSGGPDVEKSYTFKKVLPLFEEGLTHTASYAFLGKAMAGLQIGLHGAALVKQARLLASMAYVYTTRAQFKNNLGRNFESPQPDQRAAYLGVRTLAAVGAGALASTAVVAEIMDARRRESPNTPPVQADSGKPIDDSTPHFPWPYGPQKAEVPPHTVIASARQPRTAGSLWAIAANNVGWILTPRKQVALGSRLAIEREATLQLIRKNGFDKRLMDGRVTRAPGDPDYLPVGRRIDVNVLGLLELPGKPRG